MGILKPEMTKIPIRFGILAFTALLLLLSAVEATKPIENLGTWNASRPLGKMTRLEACGGPVVGPYLTLFWSEDQLMLVRESAWNNPDKILWKINALTQLRGAVYFIQRLKNCNSRHPETIYVVAALSPSYWMLTCDSAGCLVIDGPKPTPSSEKIEFIREATFPVISSKYPELVFISLKSAYQVQLETGLVSSAYHWNSTSFGSSFEPIWIMSTAVSNSGKSIRSAKQLSVIMRCRQYEAPFSSATCVVAMGLDTDDIDATTFFSPTTANFHFNNVTSKASWMDSTPGHGLIAIYERGKPEAAPLDLPFLPGEVWAGPDWRDDRHESGIVASYVPGVFGFRLWYIETKWSHKRAPEVVLRRGPLTITGTIVPIFPHPRGFPGKSDPSVLALSLNPISELREVNIYYVPKHPTANLVCPPTKYQFFAPNCKESSCDIESRGDCPHTSICFGTARGVFQCCRGPPL